MAHNSKNNIARSFHSTRHAHSTELAEDYVEAIADLNSELGEARVVQLANRLGVTHVTVNKALVKLKAQGLVSYHPYSAISLTLKGKRLAKWSKTRHEVVYNFLTALGVSASVAQIDAEGIEHHVSRETLLAFKVFLLKANDRCAYS